MKISIIIIVTVLLLSSCSKDWLDAKTSKTVTVPQTLKDLQALMNNDQLMNGQYGQGTFPFMGEVSSDDYYVIEDYYNSVFEPERNAYIWNKSIYNNSQGTDWNTSYRIVLYCNVVLEGLEKIAITPENTEAWNNCKGYALFYRSFAFFNLAQVYCKQYDESSAATDLGIPLRTISDISTSIPRSTVKETYNKIIDDSKIALELLPEQSTLVTKPSINSTNALLSRVYLSMNKYDEALLYANNSLSIYNTLMDYNTIDSTASYPIQAFNSEVFFYNEFVSCGILYVPISRIVSDLYEQYPSNDLRKGIFFGGESEGGVAFKGFYNGQETCFGGFATDELYLTKAECQARAGDYEDAMNTLNILLQNRFETASFVPYTVNNKEEALSTILKERRKELIFRGIRWIDLKRLNKDPQYAITLKRTINGVEYTLPPNDPRYVLPIPEDAIRLGDLQQNER